MQTPRICLLFRLGSALALVLVIAGCTKGGQFDPTEMFSSDVFDSKKKLTGEREPLFPNGVPGTTTGVPADLVKGYQPPPDQTDASATTPPPAGSTPGAAAPAATAEAKPKPKPKPKLAAVAKPKPPATPPTRISVGPTAKPDAPAGEAAPVQWPAPPQATPAQQSAQPAQSVWPDPPAPANH
ncbi:MAG TPA: hypothetical protein VGH13_22320 [Xanthobacteraceae bacterium]|jgi:hypothetical protein